MNKNYYVYVHRKLSDNSIFYVGKGCNGRCRSTNSRNMFWWKVVIEEGGFTPSIYKSNITEEEAFLVESSLINEIGIENLSNCSTEEVSTKDLNIRPTTKEFVHVEIPTTIYYTEAARRAEKKQNHKKKVETLKLIEEHFVKSNEEDYAIPVSDVKKYLKENNFNTNATKVAAFFNTKVKNKRVGNKVKACLFGVRFKSDIN
jgi:hypothetical protein